MVPLRRIVARVVLQQGLQRVRWAAGGRRRAAAVPIGGSQSAWAVGSLGRASHVGASQLGARKRQQQQQQQLTSSSQKRREISVKSGFRWGYVRFSPAFLGRAARRAAWLHDHLLHDERVGGGARKLVAPLVRALHHQCALTLQQAPHGSAQQRAGGIPLHLGVVLDVVVDLAPPLRACGLRRQRAPSMPAHTHTHQCSHECLTQLRAAEVVVVCVGGEGGLTECATATSSGCTWAAAS
jgi:hypothetical protein